MINAISVDLEDWYHICGVDNLPLKEEFGKYSDRLNRNVDKILALLDKYSVKATFFVVGYIAEQNPSLIKKIADCGHELASHGYYHRRIFDMTPESFEEDLVRSKDAIERVSGKKVRGYRAPEWSLQEKCEWALGLLVKNGFEYDASSNPISYLSGKKYGIYPSRIKTIYGEIYEFPLTTFRMFNERIPFTGGLPMRATPHCFVIGMALSVNRNKKPIMMYLHPWEFDAEPMKIDLPLNRRMMHYFNCKVTPTKVENMLKYFNFAPVECVLRIVKNESKRSDKNRKWIPDIEYVKSFFLTFSTFCFLYFVLFSTPLLFGWYALLLMVLGMTVLYWPWTAISNFVENLREKF